MKLATTLNTLSSLAVIGVGLYLVVGPVAKKVGAHMERRQEQRAAAAAVQAVREEIGAADDELVVLYFTDFECPFCRVAHPALDAFLKSEPKARVVLHHLPLASHRQAEPAARAAVCAEESGRGESMLGYLFVETAWMDRPDWEAVAQGMMMPDPDQFLICLSSEATGQRLRNDRARAAQLGISGTPTFVWQGGVEKGFHDDLLEKWRVSIADHR